MAYVDVKQTIWVRYRIDKDRIESFKQLDENKKEQAIYHELIESSEDSEFLYDTSEVMKYSQNNAPTIEVNAGDFFWDNTPIQIKRDIKIQKIQK